MSKGFVCLLFGMFMLVGVQTAGASLITFETAGEVGSLPDPIVVDGIEVSFSNLIVNEVGSNVYGFGGGAGSNKEVYASSAENFSGKFLTAPGRKGSYRSADFPRYINFDFEVSDVEMYIADIDGGQGVIVEAFGIQNNLLHTLSFSETKADSVATLVSFIGYSGITQVVVRGNDPIGIDTLSFV